MRRFVYLGVLGALAFASSASAAPPDGLSAVTSPRDAYERGTAAWKAHDKEAAAHWFARADALEPSESVLLSALRAARAADLPVLCMALALRTERAPKNAELRKLAREARAKYATKTGHLTATCPKSTDCELSVDGQPPPEGGWVLPGSHALGWKCDDGPKHRTLEVAAGGEASADVDCPEPPPKATAVGPVEAPPKPPVQRPAPAPTPVSAPAPKATHAHGVSPTWFWVGVGATVVLGAATTWSGLDTKSKHDDFVNGGRRDATLRDDGQSAQLRTNLLGVGAGVAAVATLGLGLFVVDFGSRAEVAVVPRPGGAAASLGARF